MSLRPKTIDNLGFETSERYAEDKAIYDQSLIKEASVSLQAQIDVTKASYLLESDVLTGRAGGAPWGLTTAPIGYDEQKNRLFTNQLIPSLGTLEKQDALLEKLQAMGISGNAETWDPTLEKQAHENKTVIALLNQIKSLNKDAVAIYEGLHLYHKG